MTSREDALARRSMRVAVWENLIRQGIEPNEALNQVDAITEKLFGSDTPEAKGDAQSHALAEDIVAEDNEQAYNKRIESRRANRPSMSRKEF